MKLSIKKTPPDAGDIRRGYDQAEPNHENTSIISDFYFIRKGVIWWAR